MGVLIEVKADKMFDIVGLEMRVCYVIVVPKKYVAGEHMLLVTLKILVSHTPNQISQEIASYVTAEQQNTGILLPPLIIEI